MIRSAVTILAMAAILVYANGCSTESALKKDHPPVTRAKASLKSVEDKLASRVVRKGDEVELTVFGYPEFSSKETIKEEGTFTIPLAGPITAVGLTRDQFIEKVKKVLVDYIKGEIRPSVSITSATQQKVTVLGAVARQDNFTVINEIGLVEILAQAGGATPESDLHRVRISRAGSAGEPTTIDLAWYVENGKVDALPLLYPGDTVYVPKKENVVRNFSEFFHDAILIFSFFRALY